MPDPKKKQDTPTPEVRVTVEESPCKVKASAGVTLHLPVKDVQYGWREVYGSWSEERPNAPELDKDAFKEEVATHAVALFDKALVTHREHETKTAPAATPEQSNG